MVRPTVFISYKSQHEPTAKAVAEVERILTKLGFEPLRDVDIGYGNPWSNELYNWLMYCSAAVVFIGEAAAASEWCRREWWFLRERKNNTGLPIIAISVDGSSDSAGILNDLQWVKSADDIDESAFETLKGLQNLRPSPASYLAAHHAWLRWQFQGAKMWEREPFSLKNIYIETECGKLAWARISDDEDPCDAFIDSEKCGGRESLVEVVMDLIREKDFREPIVVQGPPGCGKSAFTYRIANELLDLGLKPIHVRFRDFRLTQFQRAEELIEDALRIGPMDEEPPRPQDSIITDDLLNRTVEVGEVNSSEIVFILDGWDEVSLTGNASYKSQLVTWLPRFRQYISERPGNPIKLILTGRPSAEVEESGILNKTSPVLTIRNLRPEALRKFADKISTILEKSETPDEDRWTVDLKGLAPVFDSYQEWFESGMGAGKVPKTMDVMGSPLLAFLALRTLADWSGDPAKLIDEPTALYKVLIDITVEHSGQGTDQQLTHSVRQSGGRLRFLLHRVAGIISILGQETLSFAELDSRLERDPAFTKVYRDASLDGAIDQESRLNTLLGLIVSFFFKGGNTNLGCEFLNKSFREFLFAESIVAVLKDASERLSGPLRAPSIEYWRDFVDDSPQHITSRRLSALLAPQWLTNDVRTHLFWLLSHEVESDRERWVWIRDLVLDVYIWWAEGVHLRPQPKRECGVVNWSCSYAEKMLQDSLPFDRSAEAEPPRSVALDAHLGDALMQITAHIHSLLRDAECGVDDCESLRTNYRQVSKTLAFVPGAKGHFSTICARINAAGWRMGGSFPANTDLKHVWLNSEITPLMYCFRTILDGADLSKTNMSGSYLREGHLRGACLSEAYLNRADLNRVDLNLADLTGAHLREAHLRGARMREANVSAARLNRADLSGADLTRANLSGAHLNGAHMRGSNLSGANLSGAHLRGTHLSEALLSGANLSGANLSGAHLSRADLSEVQLSGGRLNRADLSETNLNRAHVNGADLNGANLRGAHLRETHLSGTDLNRADLREAHLSEAHLSGARLREADMREADLREADLNWAHLSRADLSEADLNNADLREADLREADLRGADLREADLREADLRGADLRGAVCSLTRIDGCTIQFADLSTTKGLLQGQVNTANGNNRTRLPEELSHPNRWIENESES